MNAIQNVEIVEIVTIAGVSRYKLPSQTSFRDKKVRAIEAWDVSQVAKSPTNATVLNATAFKNTFFTLCVAGRERIKDIPFPALSDPQNYKTKFEINGLVIDNDKSYVTISDTGTISAGEVILLGIYFED